MRLFAVTLCCVGALRSIAAAAPCDASIDGHAVDVATHAPIEGAMVFVDGQAVAFTDDQGRFEIEDVCPGTVTVEVRRDDYQPGIHQLDVRGHVSFELELVAGEVIVVEDEAPPPTELGSATALDREDLARSRGKGLSEALTAVAGVTELGSGSGMAKPVVRGQFGRRLLLLVDGVRHRAQEWGLDHAPELDPFVADSITVVRGAAGVRYGPDAIGGAVVVEPPPPRRDPGVGGEVHLVGTANGVGGSVAARLQAATARLPGFAWQLEGTARRAAAPSTPDYPLDNTGVAEWTAGVAAAYRRADTEYTASFRHYDARLGVCTCLQVDSLEDFYAQLGRDRPLGSELYSSELAIERPYQDVTHELAIARGAWRLPSIGRLTATYAFQHDHRGEFDVVRDATTGPQFDFYLATHDVDATLAHQQIHVTDHLHLRGAAGVVGMVQDHQYGGLPLVPDHDAWSAGAFVTERLLGHDFELEAGLRYDVLARTASIDRRDFLQLVRSGQLDEDACPDGDPVACASTFHTVSASLGGLLQLTGEWAIKAEASTASRPPNPDEQYLNGTSPTFPVLGLGKPDLGPETTYAGSVTTTYQGDLVAAEASAFASYIDDYIYFAPAIDADGEPIFDVLIRGTFPRFVTRPVDAVFYGADGAVTVRATPQLELEAQVSIVRARNVTSDGFLVFVPAGRGRAGATYRHRNAHVSLWTTYVAKQFRYDRDADLATPPPDYVLVDAEVGARIRDVDVALQGTNVTNARYRDYTSLLRYFADQPGAQVLLRVSMRF